MHKVIHGFIDLKDNNHEYKVGDTYPRKGYEPTAERIAELAGADNKQGKPVIEEVKKKEPAKKTANPKKK